MVEQNFCHFPVFVIFIVALEVENPPSYVSPQRQGSLEKESPSVTVSRRLTEDGLGQYVLPKAFL
jgi:hypothetical protein